MVFAYEKHTGAGTNGRSKQAQRDEKSRRQAWNTRIGANTLSMRVHATSINMSLHFFPLRTRQVSNQ